MGIDSNLSQTNYKYKIIYYKINKQIKVLQQHSYIYFLVPYNSINKFFKKIRYRKPRMQILFTSYTPSILQTNPGRAENNNYIFTTKQARNCLILRCQSTMEYSMHKFEIQIQGCKKLRSEFFNK